MPCEERKMRSFGQSTFFSIFCSIAMHVHSCMRSHFHSFFYVHLFQCGILKKASLIHASPFTRRNGKQWGGRMYLQVFLFTLLSLFFFSPLSLLYSISKLLSLVTPLSLGLCSWPKYNNCFLLSFLNRKARHASTVTEMICMLPFAQEKMCVPPSWGPLHFAFCNVGLCWVPWCVPCQQMRDF